MDQFAGILLCGGNSRRMGRDKALLPWRGQPLVRWQVDRLLPWVSPLLVAAGFDQQLPPLPPAARVVRDAEPGRGPLSAIAGAFATIPSDIAGTFLLAVDMAGFDLGLLASLQHRLPGYDAVVCHCVGKPQPLAAIYAMSSGAALTDCLQAGQISVLAWLDRLSVRWVPEDEWQADGFAPTCFANLNTPADYAAALEASR